MRANTVHEMCVEIVRLTRNGQFDEAHRMLQRMARKIKRNAQEQKAQN